MSRLPRWLPLAVGVAAGALAVVCPSEAQTAPPVDIRIEPDTRPRTTASELGAYYLVTVTDVATGQPPAQDYDVFAQAASDAGETTKFFDCDHTSNVDSRVPRGVYSCTVFVDHGGTWTLVAFVNERRCRVEGPTGECMEREKIQATVAQESIRFELATEQVFTADEEQTGGSAGQVALLWGHVLGAAGWFTSVAAVATLAVPELRRRLSSFGLNRLERRLDMLVKVAWSWTGAVIGTGIVLIINETPYETPLSFSAIDGVFNLPYAKPYFLALGMKLALYGLMVPALVLLIRGARRQLHLGFEVARSDRPIVRSSWDPLRAVVPGTGTLLTAPAPVDSPLQPKAAPSLLVRVALFGILLGTLGISLCVTLLKYFHQLIEAGLSG